MSTDAFAPASFPRLLPSSAQAERERERVRGYADGHAEGYRVAAAAAAAAQARADADRAAREAEQARAVEAAVGALRTATDALQRRAAALTAATQTQVFAHAAELAELILSAELAEGEASASAALRRAVAAADGEDVREVRLHPDDLRVLEGAGTCPVDLAFTADESLSRGDAIVTLEDGLVDARIRAALERARRALEAGS